MSNTDPYKKWGENASVREDQAVSVSYKTPVVLLTRSDLFTNVASNTFVYILKNIDLD
jgi:DNA repair photolyase